MTRRQLAMTLTVIVGSAFALVVSAQEAAMPKPGPEHQALGFFAGKWSFEGEAKESPMGPAGKISSTESCEWFEGGFALVCRSEGQNPMGPAKALGIMSYDTERRAYTYYGLDSTMPPFTATGERDGKVWRYHTESKMGDTTVHTRVTITETSPTSYSFKMETSTDGSTWTSVMEGRSTKSAS